MKKYLKITIMLLIIIAIATTTVNATYQSKAGQASAVKTTVDNFFYNIRKMEAEGQVLGLTETINATTGVAETSNNLDCHMMKNTEYGIVALFTASGFGNVTQGYGTTQNGDKTTSTTQNETGIYQMINFYNTSTSGGNEKYEYVAAINNKIGSNGSYCGKLWNSVNKKYVDVYSSTKATDYSSAKVGDASRETAKWHGASDANFVYSDFPVFLRGANGLFSFSNYNGNFHHNYSSRAVVVCGSGL